MDILFSGLLCSESLHSFSQDKPTIYILEFIISGLLHDSYHQENSNKAKKGLVFWETK